MKSPELPKADRPLELSLIFLFFIHGIAMLATLGLLLPGMPGGSNADVAVRMHYVAEHPFIWHLGWLTWQLAALYFGAVPCFVSGLLICAAPKVIPDDVSDAQLSGVAGSLA